MLERSGRPDKSESLPALRAEVCSILDVVNIATNLVGLEWPEYPERLEEIQHIANLKPLLIRSADALRAAANQLREVVDQLEAINLSAGL